LRIARGDASNGAKPRQDLLFRGLHGLRGSRLNCGSEQE
jgi:hypothetical protein